MMWICFMCLSSNIAAQNIVDPHVSELLSSKIADDTEHDYFIVAQNEGNGEIENGSDSNQTDESGPPGEGEKQPGMQKSETDPIESFEPTEKVKADQAVDFPYDI